MRHRVDGVRHLISRILHRRRWVTNQDAEDDDEYYNTFAWESGQVSAFHEDWDKIPDMKDRFYLLLCAAPGPGQTFWTHYGKTPEEVLEKCLRQTVACVLAAVNEEYEEWKRQLKAGRLEKLLDLPKDFFTDGRVEDALRARERLPFDVPRGRNIRDGDRLLRASRASAGVFYVDHGGKIELVVRKDGKRFPLDRHKEALAYALKLSPTLRKWEEDRGRKKRLLALLKPSGGGGGVATATTGPDASPRPTTSPDASQRPAPSPEASPLRAPSPDSPPLSATSPDTSQQPAVTTSALELTKSSIKRLEKQYAQLGIEQLISTGTTVLSAFHVGHDPNTEKPDPAAVKIFQDALDAVWISDETDEESDDFERVKVLAEFERLASLKASPGQDSYKVKILKKQFPLAQSDVLNKLAAGMGFTCCLRHDLAVVEGIILAPKALGVYTFYYPGYWTKEPERREHHHWIHNLAQLAVDTAVKRRTLLNEGQLFFDKCAVAKDEARAQRDRDPATGLASPHPAYAGRRQSLVEESESDESSL